MLDNWYREYTELTDFVTKNPEIEIGMNVASIPENVRPEFYRMFDAVRLAFIKEKYPDIFIDSVTLSDNYLNIEQEVIDLLGLDGISFPLPLYRFLHRPNDLLITELFDPLFHMLKGKINRTQFEQESSVNIESCFKTLYSSGYQKWVALCLVRLLEADKSFRVILRELAPEVLETRVIMESTRVEELVPPPTESRLFSFDHDPDVLFIVPDIIIHSAKMDKYVALKTGIDTALAVASNASRERKWYPLESLVAPEPGLILMYIANELEDISLVADKESICKPDLILECMGHKEENEKGAFKNMGFLHDMLRPTWGTYIVSREPIPEQKPENQKSDVHLITTDFNRSMLTPVIDACKLG
jgi:hypothetical protein